MTRSGSLFDLIHHIKWHLPKKENLHFLIDQDKPSDSCIFFRESRQVSGRFVDTRQETCINKGTEKPTCCFLGMVHTRKYDRESDVANK